MNDADQVTGARFPLKLGDRELQMSPLSDRDICELDSWVQARVVEIARDSLKGVTDPALREETLRIAMRTSTGMSWLSGDGAKMMATVDGMARLLYQSVYRNHPGITFTELKSLLYDPTNLIALNHAFRHVNRSSIKVKEKEGENKKGSRVKRRTRRTSTGH